MLVCLFQSFIQCVCVFRCEIGSINKKQKKNTDSTVLLYSEGRNKYSLRITWPNGLSIGLILCRFFFVFKFIWSTINSLWLFNAWKKFILFLPMKIVCRMKRVSRIDYERKIKRKKSSLLSTCMHSDGFLFE